jgi:hypothetical protein
MLDRDEREVRRTKVRASRRQLVELLEWADGVKPRTWAEETAGGWASDFPAAGRRRDGAERAGGCAECGLLASTSTASQSERDQGGLGTESPV